MRAAAFVLAEIAGAKSTGEQQAHSLEYILEKSVEYMIADKRCFIDLHLHLDGSISVKSARELAEIENVELPDGDRDLQTMLMVSDDCKDLNEYLEKFRLPCSLLQSPKSIELATYNLCEELDELGLIYAEIRFAPQKFCEKGLSQEQTVQAAIAGLQRSRFKAQLILCCMRDAQDNSKENLETVAIAGKYRSQGVCACDLAGAEALFANEKYAYVFDAAKELGVRFTIHSGEASGAESVKTAIEFGASRIGHGVRAVEDDRAVALLVEKKIPIEVCPTSNINTNVFKDISDMPIMDLLHKGVRVTINSDNMSVSNTNVVQEMEKVVQAFSLGNQEIRQLLIHSANAAFLSDAEKTELIGRINASV